MPSRITSPYGMRQRPSGPRMHQGIDISGELGQPVYALLDGVVTHATINGAEGFSNYGHTVVVRHDRPRVWTLNAHLLRPAVVPGQRVQRGSLLGWIGKSRGRYDRERRISIPDFFHASRPHLHFEVRTHSLPADYGVGNINPQAWLASQRLPLPTDPPGRPPRSPPAPVAPVRRAVPIQPPAAPAVLARTAAGPGPVLLLLGLGMAGAAAIGRRRR